MSTVIAVENLSKLYRLGSIGSTTLRADLSRGWARLLGRPDPTLKVGTPDGQRRDGNLFWALRDISFEVAHGEALGIIGRNGAGKSTLLKLLSRVTAPTTGSMRVKGRIASLLEVGTGFNPELTGRENVYLNGAILGMSKREIRSKFDEIVDFSGVEEFIDTPVKRYSSGMYVRLAFAVAAHLEPEILIVDEVLAVGDAQFQAKCLGKMRYASEKQGRTVLFVSHNLQAVASLCSRAVLLSAGRIEGVGDVASVLGAYLATSMEDISDRLERAWSDPQTAPGNAIVRFQHVRVAREAGSATGPICMATPFAIEVDYWHLDPLTELFLGIVVYSNDGSPAFESYSLDRKAIRHRSSFSGLVRSRCFIPGDLLNEGVYRIRIQFIDESSTPVVNLSEALVITVHDTAPRQVAWYGRHYGPVHPKLRWTTESIAPEPEGPTEDNAPTGIKTLNGRNLSCPASAIAGARK